MSEVSARQPCHVERPIPGVCEVREIQDLTDPWWVDLDLNGSAVKFKVDPGADVSVIALDTYRRMQQCPKLKAATVKLQGVSAPIQCHGTFHTTTQYQGQRYKFKVYVADCVNNLL